MQHGARNENGRIHQFQNHSYRNHNALRYITHHVIVTNVIDGVVIRSFKEKRTEAIFEGRRARGLPIEIQQRARRKLRMIDAASAIDDLRIPPSNRLEKLKGDRRGQHSIRINDQWRICFVWNDDSASEVEIVDYH